MKKLGLLAMASVAMLVFAQPASAQQPGTALWTNLTFGMTEAEVLAAQPTATKPRKPDVLTDKAVCALELQAYNVVNRDFHACFYFTDGKLDRVILDRKLSTDGDFEDIRNQLRTKYGTEAEAQTGSKMLSLAKWHGETNTVILLLTKSLLDPRFGKIMWIYREPMPSTNDKL
ncbi:hypothetical protein [Caulobacter sp.]|uniref:hypothetical protein n=1 Tax=Caulobacter sp. TaxID=78 RepID=UPI001B1F7DDC|nr:hypothetical protein [Caulobacter sp.]MBO9543932.1 hypothetical protein [Caulobacter sp.]